MTSTGASTGADHSTFGPSGAGPVLVIVPEGAGDARGAIDAEGAEAGAAVSAFADCPKIADLIFSKIPMVSPPVGFRHP